MAARRSDWQNTPLPERRDHLSFEHRYSSDEFARLCEGVIPQEMEDKWFVYFEEPWLYLHRSWTGFCVYQVRFAPTEDTASVAEVLVSRDPEEYTETDSTRDTLRLAYLLDSFAGRETEAAWQLYVTSLPPRA